VRSKTIQKKRGRKPKGHGGRAKKEEARSAAKPTPPQSEFKRPRGRPRKTPLPPCPELLLVAEESEDAEMPSELGY
jgi:DNA segregation ATPase FtsK/SpoIIIE-like protein